MVALCLGMLTGCRDDSDPSDSATTGAVSADEAQQLLDTRSAALRDGDLKAFLATLDPTDNALLKRQRRYFANLQALPIETLDYTVLKSQWPHALRAGDWGAHVSVPQVRVATQLAGFDSVPVKRITGFAFARLDGRPVIISEITGKGKQFPGSSPAPWDLVRIHVRTDGATLQLYDDDTWPQSAELSRVIGNGIDDVESALPFHWDGRVVVYVFGRKAVLNSFEGVPGGNINHLGAMTFPMYAVLGQPEVAGIRFTLLPSSVRAGQPFLDRITRHELTHVAVGDRDDGAPIWFAEGLAEYLGARSIEKDKRRIATVAVERARRDDEQLPSSQTFNGPDQAWNYALSWMACDYIAATQGEARLWELMDALHNGGEGVTDEEQDPVLQRVLGFDSAQLARRAERRILRIYG
ncbi:hypothetical protein EFK50_02360 [Nocardioides marmoriginsengisoli]|uniref:Peptidase MA-like domain-containing protein n=1 Tax=Nocardioides marmoriginsengisoli TaxID=661483 RepID=A0A3N0CN18_9ACTN|nr:hypothetical protein EFK50_02360 [Nocardioides marmoriginsengisoli]